MSQGTEENHEETHVRIRRYSGRDSRHVLPENNSEALAFEPTCSFDVYILTLAQETDLLYGLQEQKQTPWF